MNIHDPELRQRYAFSEFLYYTALAAVPFFTAFLAIFNRSISGLVGYTALCTIAILLIYRHFCTHCPYYTGEGRWTKCMFIWGVPKFFQRRPGPLGFRDKAVSLTASAVLIVFPLYWLFQQPGLLLIFLLSLIVFLMTILRNECRRCAFVDCPVNKAPDASKPNGDI